MDITFDAVSVHFNWNYEGSDIDTKIRYSRWWAVDVGILISLSCALACQLYADVY